MCTEIPAVPGDYCCGDGECGGPEDSSSCALDCGAGPICGNDLIETGETCDGFDLDGHTCFSLGFEEGTLSCQSDCLDFDTSACTTSQCVPTHSKEKGPRCSDGIDNDCDGDIDGADSDC